MARILTDEELNAIHKEKLPWTVLSNNLYERADKIATRNELSDEQRNELSNLQDRYDRLQPIQTRGALGSNLSYNNPYAIDSRSLMSGLASLGDGAVNRVRRQRLEDQVMGSLRSLEQQKQEHEQDLKTSQHMLSRLPELQREYLEQMGMIERNDADNTRIENTNRHDNETRIELNKLDKQKRVEIERIQGEAKQYAKDIDLKIASLKHDPTNGAKFSEVNSAMTQFRLLAKDLDGRADQLQNELDADAKLSDKYRMSNEEWEQKSKLLSQLKKEANDYREKISTYSLQINKFITGDNQSSAGEQTEEFDLNNPPNQ